MEKVWQRVKKDRRLLGCTREPGNLSIPAGFWRSTVYLTQTDYAAVRVVARIDPAVRS